MNPIIFGEFVMELDNQVAGGRTVVVGGWWTVLCWLVAG